MKPFRSRAWLIPIGLVLVLIVVAAIVLSNGAHGTPTPTISEATSVPTQAATQPAPATQAATAVSATAGSPNADVPMGIDANGDFYRGDPNAPVKLIEYSDFQ